MALWTLGQVVESTAYVVEPYQKYPNLLDILFSFLKSQQTIGIRREVFFTVFVNLNMWKNFGYDFKVMLYCAH